MGVVIVGPYATLFLVCMFFVWRTWGFVKAATKLPNSNSIFFSFILAHIQYCTRANSPIYFCVAKASHVSGVSPHVLYIVIHRPGLSNRKKIRMTPLQHISLRPPWLSLIIGCFLFFLFFFHFLRQHHSVIFFTYIYISISKFQV